jgi:hypothetical protein
MLKKYTIMIFCLLLVLSCQKENKVIDKDSLSKSNSVEIVTNKNIPANDKFSISLEYLDLISCSKESSENLEDIIKYPAQVLLDSKQNIYIVDNEMCIIKKFNDLNQFETTLCKKGNGPGEVQYINSALIINDTILVSDENSRKIAKFDSNGKFIKNIIFKELAPKFLKAVGNDRIIGNQITMFPENQKYYILSELNLYDTKFKKIKTLLNTKIEFNPLNININPLDFSPFYIVSSEFIFVGEISESCYRIKKYNHSGVLLKYIEKNYSKVRMTEENNKQISSTVSGNTNDEKIKNQIDDRYEKAINGLWVDKNNNLWVLTANQNNINNSIAFDIFKEDKYINTINLDLQLGKTNYTLLWNIFLVGNYLFVIDDVNEENTVIKRYSYHIK